MKLNQLLSSLMVAALAFGGVACSPGFVAAPGPSSANNTNGGAANPGALAISPSSVTIAPAKLQQFSASGGTSPYKFVVSSGSGTIDADTGLYLADSSEGSAMIKLTDAAGRAVYASIVVSNSALTNPGSVLNVTWSPNPVKINDVVTLSTSGGTAPYTYTLTTGSGSLSANVYTASSTPESVTIQVSDSASNTATISFSAGSGSGSSAPGISVTGVGVYYSGQSSAQCAGSGVLVGSIASMAGKNYSYQGEVTFCKQTQATQSASQIVSDLWLTPGGTHSIFPTCPSGYSGIQLFVDCTGGYCYGTQMLCAKMEDPAKASQFVTDFYLTNEGSHAVNPSCNSGDTSFGVTGDCGGGFCFGAQRFCQRH